MYKGEEDFLEVLDDTATVDALDFGDDADVVEGTGHKTDVEDLVLRTHLKVLDVREPQVRPIELCFQCDVFRDIDGSRFFHTWHNTLTSISNLLAICRTLIDGQIGRGKLQSERQSPVDKGQFRVLEAELLVSQKLLLEVTEILGF